MEKDVRGRRSWVALQSSQAAANTINPLAELLISARETRMVRPWVGVEGCVLTTLGIDKTFFEKFMKLGLDPKAS